MPELSPFDRIRKIFTGAGLASSTTAGTRTSYQWLGLAPYVNEATAPVYVSLVNGSISINESTDVTTYPTTACNGFVTATLGNTVITGSADGYVLAADPTPTGPTTPFSVSRTSGPIWIKVLIGSVYYECRGFITSIEFAATPDEVVKATFDFTLFGIPKAAQYELWKAGAAPL